jgi:hypothetical protein
MGRATFDGPVLSGDNRFGALRDVGSVELNQAGDLVLTNVTANTAGYSGASSQFVVSNGIPNGNGVVYSPSASTYPPVAVTPTADAGTAIYRGWVAYLPINSQIVDAIVDVGVTPTLTSGTITAITVSVGNQFNGSQYASCTVSGTGRQTVTYSATQLANCAATSSDVTNLGSPTLLSQVVFTLACTAASGLAAPFTAGKFYFTLRYVQADGNIGSTTAYPYGNFD